MFKKSSSHVTAYWQLLHYRIQPVAAAWDNNHCILATAALHNTTG
jgi:hypothetical protein